MRRYEERIDRVETRITYVADGFLFQKLISRKYYNFSFMLFQRPPP